MKNTGRALIGSLFLALLASCGGGGGSSPDNAAGTSNVSGQGNALSVAFRETSLDVSTIEGTQTKTTATVRVVNNGTSDAWFWVEETKNLVVDGSADFQDAENFLINMTLTGDVPANTYNSELLVHFCSDEACANELTGSPVRLPIRYVVKPNIHVQSTVTLRRAGREPAPSTSVQVDIPSEAGPVTAQVSTLAPEAMSATLSGSTLTIQTQQVKAGTYSGMVTLAGQADTRYKRTVEVSYTVSPPAGGEVGLTVDPPSLSSYLKQGGSTTARFKVTRPSWTTQWATPALVSGNGIFSLRDLGNDEYEVTVNGVGAAAGGYSDVLRFSAGPTTGNVDVPLSAMVVSSFAVGKFSPDVSFLVNEFSVESDLATAMPVTTFDGVPATWSAVSRVPWLTLTRSTGTTGLDDLSFKLDKAFVQQHPGLTIVPAVDVSINRAGALPITVRVFLGNSISQLQRVTSGALAGARGRIYVAGEFDQYISADALLAGGYLTVNGAMLEKASLQRSLRTLILDVSGALPGRPVTVSWVAPLGASQVSTTVQTPVTLSAFYQALPFARYRPAQYVEALQSAYWAGGGQLYRWAFTGNTWQLSQVPVNGLIDATVSSDGARIYALAGRNVLGLDPTSLSLINSGSYTHLYGATLGVMFDELVPTTMKAVAMVQDGQSFASVRLSHGTAEGEWGVVSVEGGDPSSNGIAKWDLATAPHDADFDRQTRAFPGLSAGAGIVVSAGGQAMATVDPDGKIGRIYRAEMGSWGEGSTVPAGLSLVALDDNGDVLVRSDGQVVYRGEVLGSRLDALLPASHQAGGYGLTRDGRYALIYGYRIVSGSRGERAQDATVWVADIQALLSGASSTAVLVGHIGLPDAVGCTQDLVTGETCRHTAQVLIDRSATTVFVLGPRGIATAMLAPTFANAAAATPVTIGKVSSGRAQAQSVRVKAKAVTPLIRLTGR